MASPRSSRAACSCLKCSAISSAVLPLSRLYAVGNGHGVFCTLLGRAGICTCSVEEGPDPWGTMTMVSWPSSDAWNCWPGPTPAGTVTAKVCIIGLLAPGRDIVYGHPRHVRQEAAREGVPEL